MSARFWAVVPAAGIGSRMASAIPKQYLTLLGEPVISHSISRLLACRDVERVVVAIADQDVYWSDLVIAHHDRVSSVTGGRERADSVLAGLNALAEWADEDDWVLVHDAARPCVSSRDIEALCQALCQDKVGGIMAVPIADTLKRADRDDLISETVEREGLWAAQTPQLFRYGLLRDSLQRALAAGVAITDEASALEWAGQRPKLFPGSKRNLKITVPEDIEMATLILDGQMSEEIRRREQMI